MTLTPSERDETLGYEVIVREDGDVVNRTLFDTLEEAERFAEQWSERVLEAECEIEDRSRDHTGWQAVEVDTAVDEDYERPSDDLE